jgi:predicted TIM-barrel fold metal-dependent hydrolase
MIEVMDASILWGTDAWVRDNRPELRHSVTEGDWREWVKQSERNRIRIIGGLVMPFPSTPVRDFRAANAQVRRACASYGAESGLLPVFAVRPGDTQSVDDLEAILDDGKSVAGVKLWPYMGGFNLDEVLHDQRLIQILVDRKLLLLMHVGNGRERMTRPVFPDVRATPDIALRCARELPDIPIIIGHLARLSEKVLLETLDTSNLYLDYSGLTSLGRWQEGGRDGLPVDSGEALAREGAVKVIDIMVNNYNLQERILFGTTWPFCTWWNIGLEDDVAVIERANINASARSKIYSGNLARLLERQRVSSHH